MSGEDTRLVGVALLLMGIVYTLLGLRIRHRRKARMQRAIWTRSLVHYLDIERRPDGTERWTCEGCSFVSELDCAGLNVQDEGDGRVWHTARGSMFDPRMGPVIAWADAHVEQIQALDDAYRQPD